MMVNVRLQIMPPDVCIIKPRTEECVPVLTAILPVVPDALQVYVKIYLFNNALTIIEMFKKPSV